MNPDDLIPDLTQRIAEIRRDIHAHPELAFGEWRTSEIVAKHLEALGLTVQRGVAGTGVVASGVAAQPDNKTARLHEMNGRLLIRMG